MNLFALQLQVIFGVVSLTCFQVHSQSFAHKQDSHKRVYDYIETYVQSSQLEEKSLMIQTPLKKFFKWKSFRVVCECQAESSTLE